MMRCLVRCLMSVIIMVCVCLLSGATWWEGLDVDLSDYERPYFSSRGAVEAAAEDLAEELAEVDITALVERCRQVLNASVSAAEKRAGDEEGRANEQRAAPGRKDFLLCMAMAVRMQEDGNESSLSILADLHEKIGGVEDIPVGYRGRPGRFLLSRRFVDAYRQIAAIDDSPAVVVHGYRRAIMEPEAMTSVHRGALFRAVREFSMQTSVDAEFADALAELFQDEEPKVYRHLARQPFSVLPSELYHLRVGLLMHPDAAVRQRIERNFLNIRIQFGERVIQGFLEFLGREDVDEHAKNVVTQALDRQGFRLETKADGRYLAVPTRDDREVIIAPKE